MNREEWNNVRAKGFGKHVLSKAKALVLLAVFVYSVHFIYPLFTDEPYPEAFDLIGRFIVRLVLAFIFGTIYGVLSWVWNEDKYFYAPTENGHS